MSVGWTLTADWAGNALVSSRVGCRTDIPIWTRDRPERAGPLILNRALTADPAG